MSYSYNPNAKVSSLNSSTTPLNAGATFTGQWEDVTLYESIIIAVKTDQNGTFTIEYSPDGTNIDSTLTRYYRTNQIEAPHRFTNTRRYVRVRFTNTSATNQTLFRLQVTLNSAIELNIPTDSTMAQDFDAISVRPTDYHYEIALGRRQGSSTWNKWGYNNDIDVGTDEVIWEPGGDFYPLVVATTLDISSNNTNDNSGGNGVSQIVVYGINESRKSVTEVVALNGTANVTTTNSFLGVNRIEIDACGANNKNDGKITAYANSTGQIQGTMPQGEGSTQQLIFFTQSNHKTLADWLWINTLRQAAQNPKITVKGWVHSFTSNSKAEVLREGIDTAVENSVEISPRQPFIIGPNSVFYLTASTDKADTMISARMSLIEVRDADSE